MRTHQGSLSEEHIQMNQELIDMARQADIDHHRLWNDDGTNRLEAFAALVAAAEREACAKVCVALAERNIWWDINEIEAAEECAAEIRARGETN